jgi:transposase-like protein
MLPHSKISTYQLKKILRCFCADLNAIKTAQILNLNRKTIDRYFNIFREKIAKFSLEEAKFSGVCEVDESYFGARRVRGKRGRGAAGKTPVFGILNRVGKVFVSVVPDCSKEQLMPIIQGKILEGSTIHSDGWKAYDGLILNGYDHYRVFHSKDEFARGKCHVNGIESFWSFAKRRLSKFNGLASHKFHLHLKECEFRWNWRQADLFDKIFSLLRKDKNF